MKVILERYEVERARTIVIHIALCCLLAMYYPTVKAGHPDATLSAVISYLLGHLTASRLMPRKPAPAPAPIPETRSDNE